MEFHAKNLEETLAFGARLGALLRGDETIELVGDVGAGKTTLVKGIAQALSISEPVQSPTFTILRMYENEDGQRVAHYDFYRLGEAGIMQAELSESLEDDSTIVIVEWPAVVDGVLPEDRIVISISSPAETQRVFRVSGLGSRSQAIVEKLA